MNADSVPHDFGNGEVESRCRFISALSPRLAANGGTLSADLRLLGKSEEAAVAKQPESLAIFSATAKNAGKKPKNIGLTATPETMPIPTDPKKKVDAATKVLRGGVLHRVQGADQAIDALPDRTRSPGNSKR